MTTEEKIAKIIQARKIHCELREPEVDVLAFNGDSVHISCKLFRELAKSENRVPRATWNDGWHSAMDIKDGDFIFTVITIFNA